MCAAGARASLKPVDVEMADYVGLPYAVGGGSAFFGGLLTAGLYPGVAVPARLRRHRIEEGELYLRMVDALRERLGPVGPLGRIEALAEKMCGGPPLEAGAILVAVVLSLLVLAVGPILVAVYNNPGRGAPVERVVLQLGVAGGLLCCLWALLMGVALRRHRRRSVALVGICNELARRVGAPPVRIHPVGMSVGQICWLVCAVLLGGLAGRFWAGLLGLVCRPLDVDLLGLVLPVAAGAVLSTYVLLAVLLSNHVRRWNERMLRSLSGSLARALGGEGVGGVWRFCPAAGCGWPNLPGARYCARCGRPL